MRSSSGRINISACAPTIRVDHRISLWRYFRMADNLLKQADIFREEKNVIDLYVMLLRFSSLVSETIPCHREYRASPQNQKVALKKRMLNAVNELEELKPALQRKLNELERKNTNQTAQPASRALVTYQDSSSRHITSSRPVEVQLRKFSINTTLPKAETLSKHSFLGPNGFHPQFQPPASNKGVQYPSNIDLTPVEIPSLQQPSQDGQILRKDSNNSELEPSNLESNAPEKNDSQTSQSNEPNSLISFEEMDIPVENNIRQPSPPPVLAEVQDLVPTMPSQVAEVECRMEATPQDDLASSGAPLQLHISTALMENFMRMAKSNTDKNLETCGVLAGSLKNRKFYVTSLIIPKQESTSNSCQTMNEEEIFEVQDKQSLFPLGWIHTHPTQSCFMSSIDLHTHYSYQIMLPEAVAIVMAPRDSSRKHGIFRLTTPGGMSVIRGCDKRGFHPHEPPSDGGPIYKQCTDVYMNPNLRFDVIDLR